MQVEPKNSISAISRIEAINIILKTLSESTGLRYSLVARVTEDSWMACAIYDNMNFGLAPGDELAVQTTYCNTIREQDSPLLVRHASAEKEFQNHPALKTYGVESYIGVPLYRRNGEPFGVLCALDFEPTDISEKTIETFALMAKLIAFEMEAEERQREMSEELELANQTSEARARFMSILGHDLRNPLNTISQAAQLQRSGKLDAERNRQMAETILRTTRRMKYLIKDLLDTTQVMQGNRISINKNLDNLTDIFDSIILEFRVAHPNRTINFSSHGDFQGEWDKVRLGQVLSNLLSNAISYGSCELPVQVSLERKDQQVVLQVINQGEIMSEEVRQNLFTPFWRGAKRFGSNANSSGLGLGLYIIKQIVEDHGGTVNVESNETQGTSFTVILPYS